jgi:hypothetical protein
MTANVNLLSPRLVLGRVQPDGNVLLSTDGYRFLQALTPKAVGSVTYNPANLADGAGTTTTVAATGAQTGQFVAAFSNPLQGITVTAWVSARDVVSVRFQNESGGAIDLASGTLSVRVL